MRKPQLMWTAWRSALLALASLFLLALIPTSAALSVSEVRTFASRQRSSIGTSPVHPTRATTSLGLSHSSSAVMLSSEPYNDEHLLRPPSLRTRLRRLTGFSLTAVRATLRAATGISLSAVYASTLAATGAWIRQTMRVLLSPLPTWLRYFVQPFLVLYYAPLFILRNWASPSRSLAKRKHDLFVEGWKHAVEVADESTSYWPLHVVQGHLESDINELDVNQAVADSVELALEEEESHKEV